MQIAMIGLGRMGGNMVRRLLVKGHECVVHAKQPIAMAGLQKDGANGATTLKEMVSRLTQPRLIWLMVPAAAVDQVLGDLAPLLDEIADAADDWRQRHRAAESQALDIQVKVMNDRLKETGR